MSARFHFLDELAPAFAVNGENVQVLYTPTEFYEQLVQGIRSSKKRIILSALYLGIGDHEQKLLDCLQETLQEREKENIAMEVNLLFDCVRGSRGKPNSKTMLLPLVKKYGNVGGAHKTNLSVSLYHTPFLRGGYKQVLPHRFNEIVGLNHIKIFVFDDNFLVSGANLSAEYFEQRQDRYVLFKNCSKLSDFFHSIVKAVSQFSFELQPDGNVSLPKNCPHHPVEGDRQLFERYAFDCLNSVLKSHGKGISKSFVSTSYLNTKTQLSSSGETNLPSEDVSSELEGPFLKEHNVSDTIVYPTLQFGFIGIRQDELVTTKLLESFPLGSYVCFTSGYFNITEAYASSILKSWADFDIVTASPNANGFLKASGFAGKIPAVYSYLTKKFYDDVWRNGKAGHIKVWEYLRPNWTYHAKGIWFYEKQMTLPTLTMIGSSNFGQRSVNRDLEAQVTIVTRNKNLMNQLHREKCGIMKDSSLMKSETFAEHRYHVPRWVSFVTNLIRRYF